MASNTISTGTPTKVPQPTSTPNFVLGSRPAVLRAPPIQRVKPSVPSTRDYGKTPPLGGGMGKPGDY